MTKKKDDSNHGKDEDYYDSHPDINEIIERKEMIKEHISIVGIEPLKSTDQ